MYHTLLGGKWNHILDQTHLGYDYWQQPMRNTIPPLGYVQETEIGLAGNMGVSVEASNGSVPGNSNYNVALSNPTLNLPPMDPYGPKTRYIEIYSRGTGAFDFEVSTGASYVTATPSSGTVQPDGKSDVRVLLSVDWSKAPAGSTTLLMNVTSSDDYGSFGMPSVTLPLNNTQVPADFHGHVESDRTVSVEAEHREKHVIRKRIVWHHPLLWPHPLRRNPLPRHRGHSGSALVPDAAIQHVPLHAGSRKHHRLRRAFAEYRPLAPSRLCACR